MFVMVEIDVGRLKMDAPEMTIWDPFLELSDKDKSDPSPLPRRGPTSRISNCSDFVKAREDAGFDAEEIWEKCYDDSVKIWGCAIVPAGVRKYVGIIGNWCHCHTPTANKANDTN